MGRLRTLRANGTTVIQSLARSSWMESNHRCRHVEPESSPLDHRTATLGIASMLPALVHLMMLPANTATARESPGKNDTNGIRTHRHQPLMLAALPFAYRAAGSAERTSFRGGSTNSGPEIQLRTRVLIPSGRPYESQLSTGSTASSMDSEKLLGIE